MALERLRLGEPASKTTCHDGSVRNMTCSRGKFCASPGVNASESTYTYCATILALFQALEDDFIFCLLMAYDRLE